MIIEWQRVGFVHGVMNTDNMSIHGMKRRIEKRTKTPAPSCHGRRLVKHQN
jgi:hypothetical protein